jgi:hypothetical protein
LFAEYLDAVSLARGCRWCVVRENLQRYAAGDKMLSVVDVTRGY